MRIWLTREHRGTVIGHAVRLHDLETALFGAFRIHEGDAGDEALAAIRAGTLTGISVQMTPLRWREVDGVTRREQAWLTGVALVPTPAYPSARVTHIRHALHDELADPASPAEVDQWERERLDAKLREIACAAIDANTRSFRSDARYQAACRLREELAREQRQLAPQVLRRGCRRSSRSARRGRPATYLRRCGYDVPSRWPGSQLVGKPAGSGIVGRTRLRLCATGSQRELRRPIPRPGDGGEVGDGARPRGAPTEDSPWPRATVYAPPFFRDNSPETPAVRNTPPMSDFQPAPVGSVRRCRVCERSGVA